MTERDGAAASRQPEQDTTFSTQQLDLGESVQGRHLTAYSIGSGPSTTLVLGGVHGDEPQSVAVVQELFDFLQHHPELLDAARVVVLPLVNPDGAALGQRTNSRLVDLNRNFPAANWTRSENRRSKYYAGPDPASEPETRAVITLVEQCRPDKAVSVHCIDGGRHCNNYDGPAEALALLMSAHNEYPVEPSIGYATPGSFGAWAGIDLRIPTVTLELPADRSAHHCWEHNREALLAVIQAPRSVLPNRS